ncbi:GntR family transcriptional regulator [Albimonas sp. CAU 1670]|uniref:FadR/GntR family transcriptional regulator n=1 Tax=Albimonas sp. CAU 1670 TaxID=3032599 RepID=UPI0023D9B8F6|nr:GntR family transcriptional regulator [Albimonas sp. CAU 1670]MDF2234907.1 GntR family transcriptional regulator [Albimonas sp. CAU 1670]
MAAPPTPSARPAGRRRAPARGLSRPQAIAETLKDWIVEQDLAPGDRLPQEAQLIALLGASKGTVREALRVLETQGLIRTRTGPGGGAFITPVRPDHAELLLANLFFFEHPSLPDLLEMRRALMPALAENLAGAASPETLAALDKAAAPVAEAADPAARQAAGLAFDEALAAAAANPVLRFTCRFLARMLAELVERPRAAGPEGHANGMAEGGWAGELIAALEARDAAAAAAIMTARLDREGLELTASGAQVARRFLPSARP